MNQMLHIPVLRWGQPYTSIDVDPVVHFSTGEPIASVSRANGGLIQRDMRKAARAREVLREIPIDDLIARAGKAGELYMNATLPIGDGSQSPEEFARAQSASTGLPERMCRANMKKNGFVLAEMRRILDSLTRGLALDVLSTGHGEERGVPISYQAQSPVVGLVLPSNSPGVHTLWLPVIPLQIGLVLKPGPQEPWTPYRMAEAFFQAGIPREAISIYPGGGDVGAAVLDSCGRNLIFGGTPTVDRYRGNPHVQAHGPGFSKILLGDDQVDRWEEFLDVMVDSCLPQQRTRLHQLLGRLGEPPHARDCRRAGEAAGRGAAAAAGPSRCQPGRVHRPWCCRRDRAGDRRRRQSSGRHRCHRRSSQRRAPPRQAGDGRCTCCRPSSIATRPRRRSRRRNTCSRS